MGLSSFGLATRCAVSVPVWNVLTGILLIAVVAMLAPRATAQEIIQGAAAFETPLKIAVVVTSRSNQCYASATAAAIKRFATLERRRINERGGIAGRPLALEFLEDWEDAQQTITKIRKVIEDEQTVALIGLSNSNRASEVFSALGPAIRDSELPWLSNISVNSIFAPYPNVFTMRGSQEDDSIPVMAQFVKDSGVARPAFLGLADNVFSSALGDGLGKRLPLVADHRLKIANGEFDQGEVRRIIDDLKEKKPDFLFINIWGKSAGAVVSQLQEAGVTPPLFVTGRLERIFSGSQPYPADVYQLAWDGLPDAYNDRVRQRLFRSQARLFRFTGRKNQAASGWATGECKEDEKQDATNILSDDNLRAVSYGLQYSDMIGMVAQLLEKAEPAVKPSELRSQIAGGIRDSLATGRGVYQGDLTNWSFRPGSRAAARAPFIVTRPNGFEREQLAPVQYVTLRNEMQQSIKTLYLDIDMTRIFRVDDEEKSFLAEFYLSMHAADGKSIEQIEFGNAFLDHKTNSRQITIRELHDGGPSASYPAGVKIYAVSGKFMFQPNFSNYPFDTQRFAIELRSKKGDASFIVQPSPRQLRDPAIDTENWGLRTQYVGYDEDFLPIIDAKSHERSIVPFYKASFVWAMKREETDYLLTVVVPLAFIMSIAYLAIFIPRAHFEAIVTIQVTALLSAVALYLTIPKVDADEATLSDKLFLLDYMLISLMIGISILRVNKIVERAPLLRKASGLLHVLGIPVLVVLVSLYIAGSRQSEGQAASAFLPAIQDAVQK